MQTIYTTKRREESKKGKNWKRNSFLMLSHSIFTKTKSSIANRDAIISVEQVGPVRAIQARAPYFPIKSTYKTPKLKPSRYEFRSSACSSKLDTFSCSKSQIYQLKFINNGWYVFNFIFFLISSSLVSLCLFS
jgi:hypothetical protein